MTNAVLEITNSSAAINGLDVVRQVDEFYSTAFDHLLWLLGTLILLLGIAVPVAFYFFQKRQLALKEQKLTAYLKEEVSKLEKSFRQENENFVVGLEKNLKGEIAHAKAGICLVQGNAYKRAGEKKKVLSSYAWTLKLLTQTLDRKQTQSTARFIGEEILPTVNKNDCDAGIVTELTDAINLVGEIKAGGLLDTDIENYKTALVAAQARN